LNKAIWTYWVELKLPKYAGFNAIRPERTSRHKKRPRSMSELKIAESGLATGDEWGRLSDGWVRCAKHFQ
jgi:hypothetical protein